MGFRPVGGVLLAVLAVNGLVWAQEPSTWSAEPMLHLIDTGEGQSIVLDMGTVEIMIDGGESRSLLREYLERADLVDGPIELIVVSHTDIDAYAGFTTLVEPTPESDMPSFAVGEIWLPGEYRTEQEIRNEAAGKRTSCPLTRPYRDFLQIVRQAANARPVTELHVSALVSGKVAEFQVPGIPGVHFTMLSSGFSAGNDRDCSRRRNNASTILALRMGTTRILFGGDAYGMEPDNEHAAWVEGALLDLESRHPGTLPADILIVPRRGSNLASSRQYIDAINPRFALFGSSVRFLHPRPEVLERYRSPDRRLLYTRLNPAADRDHIVCELAPEIDCRYGSRSLWRGHLGSGEELSETQVRRAIQQLRRPMVRFGETPQEALARVDAAALVGADLSGLRWASCEISDLPLSRVSLRGAELQGCEFTGTDLAGVDFSEAILTNATFREAKLDGADFSYADLRGARFIASMMDSVHLRGANISDLVFEPTRWSLRNPQDLRRSPHLPTLRYENSPHALYELRADLRESGLRRPEREITYIIERGVTIEASGIERVLRWLGFEITSEYGRRPGRPILILFSLIPLFAVAYWVPVRWNTRAGVYLVPSDPPTGMPEDVTEAVRVRSTGMTAVGRALQFSTLSAFHIGWRELNVGNWISRMQPRSYGMTATGWVKTVTGVQALISVYLLALAVLTYFGRPFG